MKTFENPDRERIYYAMIECSNRSMRAALTFQAIVILALVFTVCALWPGAK